jgi:ABC-2 type transport system permease protein
MFHKYLTIFSLSWQDELTYRLNFFLWRVRNVLRLLLTYFLWTGVFLVNSQIAGYSSSQMLTYVFLVLVVQSLVLSAPSGDSMGSEIGSGDLSNYLVKPLNYLKYWFTRDIASKCLNLSFAVGEIALLWLWLRPPVSLPAGFPAVLGFLILVVCAVVIYFFFEASARFIAFWTPEYTWGLAFLTLVFIETLSGMIFPLDLLPAGIKTFLDFTPFPYLIYYPISVYVGRISGIAVLPIIIKAVVWAFLLSRLTKYIWSRGLRVYGAEGR